MNDNRNFDSIKQIDGENNKVIMIATKGTVTIVIKTTVNKTMTLILNFPSVKLHATIKILLICLTLYH